MAWQEDCLVCGKRFEVARGNLTNSTATHQSSGSGDLPPMTTNASHRSTYLTRYPPYPFEQVQLFGFQASGHLGLAPSMRLSSYSVLSLPLYTSRQQHLIVSSHLQEKGPCPLSTSLPPEVRTRSALKWQPPNQPNFFSILRDVGCKISNSVLVAQRC